MKWRTRDQDDEIDEPDFYYEDEDPYDTAPYVIVEKSDIGVGPFLLGILLGAGAALLFAPQSGEETRAGLARSARRVQQNAQDLVEDVSDNVADKFRQVRDSVEERIEATFDAVDDKRRRVSNAYNAGRAAAREARGELEQRIADTKAAYKES
ncbi:MAG TPA: YtxH domain-containing protein [Gemmatimonadaceae bacterium]|nr:YtxH domain-containing protein [Gemmatimonadaceae bacterium]